VQWHPEWQAKSNPVSVSLFQRFGSAAKGLANKTTTLKSARR